MKYKPVFDVWGLVLFLLIPGSLFQTCSPDFFPHTIISIGSPPQLTPVGSIHIITAPPTAPIAMKMVTIFRNIFMVYLLLIQEMHGLWSTKLQNSVRKVVSSHK